MKNKAGFWTKVWRALSCKCMWCGGPTVAYGYESNWECRAWTRYGKCPGEIDD